MLLDMVMLATGMRQSLRSLLLSRGFQLRVAPKGTLPFDTEATLDSSSQLAARLRANPDVVSVSPVLGGHVHVRPRSGEGAAITSVALGLESDVQGDYQLQGGRDASAEDALVVNDAFLSAAHRRVGDTLTIAVDYDPQLRAYAGTRLMRVTGRARFLYLAAGQRAVAMPLSTLQALGGATRADRASLLMVRARDGADVERTRLWIERTFPRTAAISTETAMRQVDERLSYFRQLAFILGSVSLVVGFLLVTTLVTVSVNERLGEIAVLRAIGVARHRVVTQIVLEGVAIMSVATPLGLALGLVTARWLNGILAAFPGLPEAIDFFLFQPAAAWASLGMLAVSGVLAGVYPSWRGASQPIAITLRQEAIG